jgi:hypothetical protein
VDGVCDSTAFLNAIDESLLVEVAEYKTCTATSVDTGDLKRKYNDNQY